MGLIKGEIEIQISWFKCSQSQSHLEVQGRLWMSKKQIRDGANQSILISQWWACFVFFFPSSICRMLSEVTGLCQQKYGSNKSVYCYGGNYFNRKCTSLRLYPAFGKLQNVLPLLFPSSSSLPMTPSMAMWKKVEGDNKKEWILCFVFRSK